MSNAKRIIQKLESYYQDKLAVVGEIVSGSAKAICPVGNYPSGSGIVGGRAKASISWATKAESGNYDSHPRQGDDKIAKPDGDGVKIGSNVDYFIFLELGTSKMQRYAPLRKALAQKRHQIKQILKL